MSGEGGGGDGGRIEIVLCRTGVGRHDPELPSKVHAAGGLAGLVDCFDRCDACELAVLCRIDGTSARFRSGNDLIAALAALRESA